MSNSKTELAAGLVVVDKPAGMTSHDVVSRVRKIAQTRKVGHAGTLDPMATGVLLLGVNKATRLLGYLQLADKKYTATIRLGVSTNTDDAEGEVLTVVDPTAVTEIQIQQQLAGMVGEIQQRPAAVSAIKVAGKRAYQRVRDGEDVDLPPRSVQIHDLEIQQIRRSPYFEVDIAVHCSTGTYIRAIARDLGEILGVGGHLTKLRRTAVAEFDLTSAPTLTELTENFQLIPLATVAKQSFPSLTVSEADAIAVGYGQKLDLEISDQPHAIFNAAGDFLALYRGFGAMAKPISVFI